jgi:phosphatidate cytidylyltransferase
MLDASWIRNPFSDEMFFFLATRIIIVLTASALLMFLTNLRRLRQLFQTTIWKKFVVWSVLAPCILVLVYSGYLAYLLFVTFILLQATREYIKLVKPPSFYATLLWCNHLLSLLFVAWTPEWVLVLPLLFLLTCMGAVAIRNRVENEVNHVWALLFGTMWLGLTLALFASLFHLRGGPHGIVVIVGVVCLSDVFAVFFGKLAKQTGVGRRPLASEVSPNKTMAGVAGNVVGATVAFAVYDGMAIFGWFIGIPLAFVIAFLASAGDLVESLLKRTAGVKDSGTLIPHHGGMLDRIDSLLPTVIIYWLVVQALEKLGGLSHG